MGPDAIICQEELERIYNLGISQGLNNKFIGPNFKHKLISGIVNQSDLLEKFPIYGNIIMMKLRNRLVDKKKKQVKIDEAVPLLVYLCEDICRLNIICA